MEYAQQTIIDFLSGNLDIVEFRRLYDEKPEIDAFLQKIIDEPHDLCYYLRVCRTMRLKLCPFKDRTDTEIGE